VRRIIFCSISWIEYDVENGKVLLIWSDGDLFLLFFILQNMEEIEPWFIGVVAGLAALIFVLLCVIVYFCTFWAK